MRNLPLRPLVQAALCVYMVAFLGATPPDIPSGHNGLHWMPDTIVCTPEQYDIIRVQARAVADEFAERGVAWRLNHSRNNVQNLLAELHDGMGFIALISHGSVGRMTVEVFTSEFERDNRILEIANQMPWAIPYMVEVTFYADTTLRYGISMETGFFTDIDNDPVHLEAQSPVVVLSPCRAASGTPSLCDAFRLEGATATLGYSADAPWRECTEAFNQVLRTLTGDTWRLLSGWLPSRNFPLYDCVLKYKQLVSLGEYPGHVKQDSLVLEPDLTAVRGYNSPRIAGLDVQNQDTIEEQAVYYRYGFEQSLPPPPPEYPYAVAAYPGDTAAARLRPAPLDAELRVRLLFSAHMDEEALSVWVTPLGGQSPEVGVEPDPGWCMGGVDGMSDYWVGSVSLDAAEWPLTPQGKPCSAVVHISAVDNFPDDENDYLDTDGDGDSDGDDVNHRFEVCANNASIEASNPDDGGGWPVRTYYRINFADSFHVSPWLNVRNLGSHGGVEGDSIPLVCLITETGLEPETLWADTVNCCIAPGDLARVRFEPWYCGTHVPGSYLAKMFHLTPGDTGTSPEDIDTVHVEFSLEDKVIEPDTGRDEQGYFYEVTEYWYPVDVDFDWNWPENYHDWSAIHWSPRGSCWHQEEGSGGNRYMKLSWHNKVTCHDSLITPPIQCKDCDSVHLTVYQKYVEGRHPNPVEFWEKLVAISDGYSFVLDAELPRTGETRTYRLEEQVLGGSVRFSWAHYGNSDHTSYWNVDDVRVRLFPEADRDIQLVTIHHPKDHALIGATVTPMVVVRNCGFTDEQCTVTLKIGGVVHDIRECGVPAGVRKVVSFDPWVVQEGPVQIQAWLSSATPDFRPSNDTVTACCTGIDNDWQYASQYPLGAPKRGVVMTEHRGALYFRGMTTNGHRTSYVWHPKPICNWDTIASFEMEMGTKKPKNKAGIASVTAPTDGLFATFRAGTRGQNVVRYDFGTNNWSYVDENGVDDRLKLLGPVCWDGGDLIYALNYRSYTPPTAGGDPWKPNLVKYSISGNVWSYVAGLPKKKGMSKKWYGMSFLNGALYILGPRDDSDTSRFWRYNIASGLLDTLADFPTSKVCRRACSMVEKWGHIFVYCDAESPTSPGLFRYDTTYDAWYFVKEPPGVPKLKAGAVLGSASDYLYAFPGKGRIGRYMYRCYLPRDLVPQGDRLEPDRSKDLPRLCGELDPGGGEEYCKDSSDADLEPREVSWAPDCSTLVYTREDGSGNISLYQASLGSEPELLLAGDRDISSPAWSPNGEWVAFLMEGLGGAVQVWRLSVQGGDPEQLTFDENDKYRPCWSPDARFLVYESEGDTALRLCRVSVATLDTLSLTTADDGWAEWPCFVPDGRILYQLSVGSGPSQIWIMDSTGESRVQVSDPFETCDCESPCASPDTALCAYVKLSDQGDVLCVANLDGSLEKQVVEPSAEEYEHPAFSPDGQYLVFGAAGPDGSRYLEVSVDNLVVYELTGYQDERGAPTVSSDGRWLGYNVEDTLCGDTRTYLLRRFTGGGISAFGLGDSVVDVTRDSLRVDFSIEGDARVVLRVKKGGTAVRTLIDSVWLEAGDYTYHWNGVKSDGKLALPGADYVVRIDAYGDTGWDDDDQKSLRVKGTLVPASIGVSSTWTTTNDPYVITGHNLEFSGAGNLNLTVNHGVRSLSEN